MKVIIFLVLAGLSLAAGNTDTNPSSRWACFIELQKVPEALQKVTTFLCDYIGTFDNNKDKYVAAFTDLKATLEKFGCPSDEIFKTIEQVADGAADAGAHAGEVVLQLTGGLGLNVETTGDLCKLPDVGSWTGGVGDAISVIGGALTDPVGGVAGGAVGGALTGAVGGGAVGGAITGAVGGGEVGGAITGAVGGGAVGGEITGAVGSGAVGGAIGLGG